MRQRQVRWILIGEWAAYRPSQDKIVHCQVHVNRPAFRKWVEAVHAIAFTDGTRLVLSTRDAYSRERVAENHGYTLLIEQCFAAGVNSVADLAEFERKRDAAPALLRPRSARHFPPSRRE